MSGRSVFRLEAAGEELHSVKKIESREKSSPERVRLAQIRDRWALLAGEREYNRTCAYWRELHDALVKMAHRDLGIKEE